MTRLDRLELSVKLRSRSLRSLTAPDFEACRGQLPDLQPLSALTQLKELCLHGKLMCGQSEMEFVTQLTQLSLLELEQGSWAQQLIAQALADAAAGVSDGEQMRGSGAAGTGVSQHSSGCALPNLRQLKVIESDGRPLWLPTAPRLESLTVDRRPHIDVLAMRAICTCTAFAGSTLTRLVPGWNVQEVDGLDNLLGSCQQLRELDLAVCSGGAAGIDKLTSELSMVTTLRSLSLDISSWDAEFDDDGVDLAGADVVECCLALSELQSLWLTVWEDFDPRVLTVALDELTALTQLRIDCAAEGKSSSITLGTTAMWRFAVPASGGFGFPPFSAEDVRLAADLMGHFAVTTAGLSSDARHNAG